MEKLKRKTETKNVKNENQILAEMKTILLFKISVARKINEKNVVAE